MSAAQLSHVRDCFSRDLEAFWDDGAGCSHLDLDRIFRLWDVFTLETSKAMGGSKKDRVREVILSAPEDRLWLIIEALTREILQGAPFDPTPSNDPKFMGKLARLERDLAKYGYRVDRANGELLADIAGTMDEHATVESLQDRLQRATADRDVEQMIGTSKEMIEAVCKHVLVETGGTLTGKETMPALITAAQRALGMHAKQMPGNAAAEEISKKILGSLTQIAIGVNDLRNLGGTGHGRPDTTAVRLSVRHARMAAGAAQLFAQSLIDKLAEVNPE